MALTVSSDLSVSVTTDQNVNKLTDIQEVLRKRIQKGEPKSMGISQVMLGFMIISYSVPLLSSEFTEVVTFGVPWWSGISFVIAGTVALIMEKHSSVSLVFICLVLTLFAAVISVIAIIIYMVDIVKHPQTTCQRNTVPKCGVEYHLTRLSVEIKSILMSLSMVQTGIASAFGFILYRERQNFNNYMFVN
ncbi:transmembrane protein 176 [Tachysurus fulvidraco]|uniref:transmembrane protein 176 n=1 Tax=Tachysurus fulvidraco TaxID=1234273 RepID=UPI000F509A02|nr:transmembrane protein 176 [Tachysurus fulvidraco]XP_047668600.1 transmembrane protein 176 [Tachysurus fulvidraco]